MSLGRGCVYKGIVEHELMHALGAYVMKSEMFEYYPNDVPNILYVNLNLFFALI